VTPDQQKKKKSILTHNTQWILRLCESTSPRLRYLKPDPDPLGCGSSASGGPAVLALAGGEYVAQSQSCV
jgi:hypothetical protein